MQSAQDLVLSQSNAKGTTPKYPGLWGDVWVMYTTIVQGIHAGESLSTDGKRTVQSLVDSLSEVYARLRPLFSPSDTRKVRRMCLDDPRTLYSKLLNPSPSRTWDGCMPGAIMPRQACQLSSGGADRGAESAHQRPKPVLQSHVWDDRTVPGLCLTLTLTRS